MLLRRHERRVEIVEARWDITDEELVQALELQFVAASGPGADERGVSVVDTMDSRDKS